MNSSSPQNDELSFAFTCSGLRHLLAMGLMVGAAAVLFIFLFGNDALRGSLGPIFVTTLSGGALIYSIICVTWATHRLTWSTPALLMNEGGVTDNTSLMSVGHVPWNRIAEIKVKTTDAGHEIGLVVTDANEVLQSLPGYKKLLVRFNSLWSPTPFWIGTSGLSAEPQHIIEVMQSRWLRSIRPGKDDASLVRD